MVEIPMDDTGEGPLFFEVFGLEAVPLCGEPVGSGGFQEIPRVGAVAGDAAVCADLFEREPLAVLGEDHRERRRAAFERFHLHDDGNFCNALSKGAFLLVLIHSAPHPKRKEMGETTPVTIETE